MKSSVIKMMMTSQMRGRQMLQDISCSEYFERSENTFQLNVRQEEREKEEAEKLSSVENEN